MMEQLKDNPEARERLTDVATAGEMRATYDALCVVIDTLCAFMNQPRFNVEATGLYNGAGEFLGELEERLYADVDQLIFRAVEMTETDLSNGDRDHINRMLLHYEARSDMSAAHIAAVASALAVKAAAVRSALRRQEDHANAA